jgi:hypothetical protein
MENNMPSGRGKIQLCLLLLLISLCSGPNAFCDGNRESFPYQIRFGVIEPPVVAQKDITSVCAPMSNQQKDPKPIECSGLAWYNGNLLIVSDRHQHLFFTCPVNLDTMDIGTPVPNILIHNEQNLLNDAESLTVLEKDGRTSLFMMCSLSNAPDAQPLPGRRNMFRCNVKRMSPFEADHYQVFSAETIRQQLETCFEAIKAKPYITYYVDFPGQDKNTYRWGNVEGMAFTPDGSTLLCGMRNPLFEKDAIVFAVSGITEATEPLVLESLSVTDFFLLDLQGRGISDLSWDPVTKGYLITAAKSNGPRLNPDSPYPLNSLDSALFWWSGHKMESPILVARIPDMTIEAVCRLGSSRYIALGSDEGDVSEGRAARQSIITVLEFTGIPR